MKISILHPVREAGCPLANFLDIETIRKFKEKYPRAPLVVYVNSYAEAKMYADYIVTSASALRLISKLDDETVLFSPDKNLAAYVAKRSDKEIIPVPPHDNCYVHEYPITPYHIEKARDEKVNGEASCASRGLFLRPGGGRLYWKHKPNVKGNRQIR